MIVLKPVCERLYVAWNYSTTASYHHYALLSIVFFTFLVNLIIIGNNIISNKKLMMRVGISLNNTNSIKLAQKLGYNYDANWDDVINKGDRCFFNLQTLDNN